MHDLSSYTFEASNGRIIPRKEVSLTIMRRNGHFQNVNIPSSLSVLVEMWKIKNAWLKRIGPAHKGSEI
jgi:hypothetical protein